MFWSRGGAPLRRPSFSDSSDAEFSFGNDLKAFLPWRNFRKRRRSPSSGAWDVSGKAEMHRQGKDRRRALVGPRRQGRREVGQVQLPKPELSLVESQVGTQEHAEGAKAALTRRAMEFITAKSSAGQPDRGSPRDGDLQKVGTVLGPLSGHRKRTTSTTPPATAASLTLPGTSGRQLERDGEEQSAKQGPAKSEGKDQPYNPPSPGVEAEERGHRFHPATTTRARRSPA